jgi:hypothetical protein
MYSIETKLDHIEYEEDGNCPEWRTDDIKNLRKIKLDQLNNIK